MDELLNYGLIEEVYQGLISELHINAIYAIASLIGIGLILKRMAETWKEATKEGNVMNVKLFYDLMWIYVVCIAVIICLPGVLIVFENLLAKFSDEIAGQVGEELSGTYSESWSVFKQNYLDTKPAAQGNIFEKAIFEIYMMMSSGLYYILFYIQKYLVFLFFCGRYVYLILLQIVAPIAIVLALHKDTIAHFFTFLKHLLICYLMIPAYLISNSFADKIYLHMFQKYVSVSSGMYDLDIMLLFILLVFLLKLFLFNFSRDSLNKLL